MKALEETLDQCWDLLRQRRARRALGEDPDEAHVRSKETVEGYLQSGEPCYFPASTAARPSRTTQLRKANDAIECVDVGIGDASEALGKLWLQCLGKEDIAYQPLGGPLPAHWSVGSAPGNSRMKRASIGPAISRTPVSFPPQLSAPRCAFLGSAGRRISIHSESGAV